MLILRPIPITAALLLFAAASSAAPAQRTAPLPQPEALVQAVSAAPADSRAIEAFVLGLQQQVPPAQWTSQFPWGGATIAFVTPKRDKSVFAPDYFDGFLPPSSVESRVLRNQVIVAGPGAPLVGIRQITPDRHAADPYFPPIGLACAVTASVNPTYKNGTLRLEVRLTDPAASPTPVAADFSAPIEWTLHAAKGQWSTTKNFLKPAEGIAGSGLVMLEPWRPGRIPVVFVHGLHSNPRTWQDVYNELRSDPVIRSRYQFWFFRYPTGSPVPVSAALLRQALHDVREKYDPSHRNANFNHTVLIGHSMGGMLSRMMVTDPGDSYWNAVSTVPFEQANLTPDDRDLLQRVLFFRPVPFISRVIFVATPHRGSNLAQAALGDLGRRLVHIPADVAAVPVRIATMNPGAVRDADGPLRLPTSIDNLSPDNNFVRAYQVQPILVPHHSIIGSRGIQFRGEPLSDGLVPYASSHLATAESEVVVPWDHSAHVHKSAVAEMRRILLLHAAP